MALEVKSIEGPTGIYCTVVIKAKERHELEGNASLELAKAAAAQRGFATRGLANTPNIYPVDENGEENAKIVMGQIPVGWFEKEFRLSAGL